MNDLTRRRFLSTSAGAAVAAATLPAWSKILGANEQIRVAVIGVKGRGSDLWNWANSVPDVEVAALCDVDQGVLASQQKKFNDKTGRDVEGVVDMRRIFDRKDIDAVLIATPNHWHALATIWACQAGKDVYCEKPVSHSPWEGRQMVAASRKYDRIVQAGLQNRSDSGLRGFLKHNEDGRLGELNHIHTAWFRVRDDIGKVAGPTKVPSDLDYDLYCGPRAPGPLMRKNLHYDWHWQWPFGGGEMANNGVHIIDESRWMAGLGAPKRVMHVGERLVWDDDGDTPNVVLAVYDFGHIRMVAETRSLRETPGAKSGWKRDGRELASCLYYDNGVFRGSRGFAALYDSDNNKVEEWKSDSGGSHMANFFEAVRSRDRAIQRTEIDEGRISTDLCHWANIAARVSGRMSYQEVADLLADTEGGVRALESIDAQMKPYGVDIRSRGIACSGWMELDENHEWFIKGNDATAANNMMRSRYREPFVVPESV